MIKDPQALLEHLASYVKERTDIALLGLSGGADSTLVAAICAKALGPKQVIGIALPYDNADTPFCKLNGKCPGIAEQLGIGMFAYYIKDATDHLRASLQAAMGNLGPTSNMIRGNIRARIRAISLYTVADLITVESKGFIAADRISVVGTSCLSKTFIGYNTMGGELGDFYPIGRLYKSEVYQLLDYLVSIKVLNESNVDRTPTAGVWVGQEDEKELGHNYADMERAIRTMITLDRSSMLGSYVRPSGDPIAQFVWDRYTAGKARGHSSCSVHNLVF